MNGNDAFQLGMRVLFNPAKAIIQKIIFPTVQQDGDGYGFLPKASMG